MPMEVGSDHGGAGVKEYPLTLCRPMEVTAHSKYSQVVLTWLNERRTSSQGGP